MKPTSRPNGEAASANITKRIQELGDWRGETLAHVRQLIHDADPDIQEEWKWEKPKSPGTPVWSHDGGVCTGESYKQVVKLTFFRGASIKDPKKLFNSSLEGNTRRAIDLREGEKINEAAFKQLIRAAVAANSAARAQRAPRRSKPGSQGYDVRTASAFGIHERWFRSLCYHSSMRSLRGASGQAGEGPRRARNETEN